LKFELEIYDCEELEIIHTALERIQAKRDARYNGTCRRAGIELEPKEAIKVTPRHDTDRALAGAAMMALRDVPAVAISEAIKELESEQVADAIDEADANTPAIDAPTVEEAVKLAQAAINAGRMADVVAFMQSKGKKRVPDLTPEERLELAASLKSGEDA